MSSNQLILKFSLFDGIHITQEGAVVYGTGRSVSIESCFFNDIITTCGGSCVDLSSSPSFFAGSSCFSHCKNTNYSDYSFANVIKFLGDSLNISRISSTLCADTTNAGDSMICGDCTDISMNDVNASTNYSPLGASSLAARSKSNTQMRRCIDINSASHMALESTYNAYLSYSSFINTTHNKRILNVISLHLSWCIFIDQCDILNTYNPVSCEYCYSDQSRTELGSTVTDKFDIHIDNIDFHQCRKNVEDNWRECSSGGNLKIGKMMILFLSLLDDDPLSIIRSSPSPSASKLKSFPSSLSKLDSLSTKLSKILTKEYTFRLKIFY